MNFVQEGKLDEEKKRRQAEWERVRGKDDPIEAPPEVFDNRTLYEKLQEQHEMKKKEFEDSYALKNQIRGVDSDEVQFLNEIDRARLEKEREIRMQEKKELDEVKKASAQISTTAAALPKITVNLPTNKKENKQADLLSNAIKRKSSGATASNSISASATLVKLTDSSFEKIVRTSSKKHKRDEQDEDSNDFDSDNDTSQHQTQSKQEISTKSHLIVAGILPGIGEYYSDSSSLSENSTDDDDVENEGNLDTHAIINRNSSDTSSAAKLSKM